MLPQRRSLVQDVNAHSHWAAGHVPRAVNLDPLAFSEDDLSIEKHAALVFYCSNFLCRKAPEAARRAKAMGYTNVRVMSAGIQGWRGQGLPVEAG
ncbi:MAG TPA: rhodanese-like domain-containing protein [Lysobacter sp.]|nr:rhodanese-like domain-containing protein [Lysobacter sp.]